jgi:predicted rRNA methylase YqxC with S4 and FtsJ domains
MKTKKRKIIKKELVKKLNKKVDKKNNEVKQSNQIAINKKEQELSKKIENKI